MILKNGKLITSILAVITLCAAFVFNVKAADGDVDSSFVSRLFGGIDQGTGVDQSTAQSVALQPDGKMLVGGTFKSFANRLQSGIARLNADGSPDYAFYPVLNGSVRAVAVQADGKILIGGEFTTVGGQARTRVARLNADGTLDASLQNPSVNNIVYAITVQPDGRILIGGKFDAVGGQQRLSLARVNTDGSLDATFGNPPISSVSTVYAVTLQADGRILVGGDIFVGSTLSYLGRLNANGTLDATFQGYANAAVYKIKIQADGKILVGGSFTRVGPVNNRFDRKTLARLNADGTVDPSLGDIATTVSPFGVYDFVTLPGGRIIIGGSFGFFAPRPGLTRLESDGTVDLTFDAKIQGTVVNTNALVLQPDGKILVGGDFDRVRDQARNTFVRLNVDGSLDLFPKDLSLNSTGSNYGRIRAMTVQPDGKILLGGYFTSAGGRTRRAVVRVNPDSTIDTTFGDPGIEQFFYTSISALVVQPDGKILVGGNFALVNGQTKKNIIRLNADGSLDASFNANVDDVVYAVALQPDGKVLISGLFGTIDGQATSRLARLNANGSFDPSFNRGTDFGLAYSINVLPDGKILAPGSQVGSPGGLYRYNANGTRDTSFTITDSGGSSVQKSFVQPDGKIVIIGSFSNLNGQPRPNIARLNANGTLDTSFQVLTFNQGTSSIVDAAIQPNGKILIGGSFSSINGAARKNVARLNADGSLDATFSADVYSYVYDIALQADTKILLGGDFTDVNGTGADYVVRLMGGATAANPCAPAAINFGQTVNGNLGVNGCAAFTDSIRDVAPLNPSKDKSAFRADEEGNTAALARYSDYYTFSANAGQQIAVSMSSSVFDTYLYLLNASGTVIAENDDIVQGNTNSRIPATGFFTVPATGTYTIRASSYNDNSTGAYTLNLSLNNPTTPNRAAFDFDGDGKSDVSVFRPSNGTWYLQQSQNGFAGLQFGAASDRIVPADYDGDGKTDVAVFRAGTWYIQRSQLGFTGVQFGAADDIPAPGDFDADGKADIAVFRPSNGIWYLLQSTAGFTGVQFGQAGDKPVAADYDGDGKTDVAVFRNGTWYINRSQLGFVGIQFGDGSDRPTPADYDGDGKADVAVFRPSNGTWYLNRSQLGFTGIQFGTSTDQPTPGDYDGDGKTDVAVYRQSAGAWYLNRSQTGFTGVPFGAAEDRPVPNAFVR